MKSHIEVHPDNVIAIQDLDARLVRYEIKHNRRLDQEQEVRAKYIFSGFYRADCWHWVPVRRLARYIISGAPLPPAPPRPGTPG